MDFLVVFFETIFHCTFCIRKIPDFLVFNGGFRNMKNRSHNRIIERSDTRKIGHIRNAFFLAFTRLRREHAIRDFVYALNRMNNEWTGEEPHHFVRFIENIENSMEKWVIFFYFITTMPKTTAKCIMIRYSSSEFGQMELQIGHRLIWVPRTVCSEKTAYNTEIGTSWTTFNSSM